mgnify:CR=1 FL=1
MWHKDSLQAFESLKKAFDPDNIFNPGTKIPLPGQKALEDIKYDPALKPLPAAARAARIALVRAPRNDLARNLPAANRG